MAIFAGPLGRGPVRRPRSSSSGRNSLRFGVNVSRWRWTSVWVWPSPPSPLRSSAPGSPRQPPAGWGPGPGPVNPADPVGTNGLDCSCDRPESSVAQLLCLSANWISFRVFRTFFVGFVALRVFLRDQNGVFVVIYGDLSIALLEIRIFYVSTWQHFTNRKDFKEASTAQVTKCLVIVCFGIRF